jgi:hypothetical protein
LTNPVEVNFFPVFFATSLTTFILTAFTGYYDDLKYDISFNLESLRVLLILNSKTQTEPLLMLVNVTPLHFESEQQDFKASSKALKLLHLSHFPKFAFVYSE